MKILRFYCNSEGCNKSFRSETQLMAHTESHSIPHEALEDSLKFQCEVCNCNFPTKRSVSAHRRIHRSQISPAFISKAIGILTARLCEPNLINYTPAKSPFTVEDIRLSPISNPTLVTLPPFSSLSSEGV